MKTILENHKKVIIITNIPTPYRLPLFNEIGNQLAEKDIDFKVIFGAYTYSRRKWKIDLSQCKFDYQVLNSKTFRLRNKEKTMFFYSGLLKILIKEKPDASIVIGFSLATLKLLLFSILFKKPYLIWSGSIHSSWRKMSFIRKLFRKFLIKRAKGFVAYGTRAKDYLIKLGATPENIEIGINTTDIDYFITQVATKRKNMGYKELFHILYIGYLEPKKRIDQVLFALKELKAQRIDFMFIIVGDGSDMARLIKLANDLGISELVKFEGFKQRNDLPNYLAQADCFIFPSEYDVWGMVLVEAMAAGLICISSIRSGATIDLIEEGKTGFAIDFYDRLKIVDSIRWILDHPKEQREIANNASRFIRENVTLAKSAAGFVNAIEKAI